MRAMSGGPEKGRMGTPRAREPGASTAPLLLGAALAVSGCTTGASSSTPPENAAPRALAVAANARALAGSTANPPRRVREAAGNGESSHFSDPERVAKIRAAAEELRAEFERELAALKAPGFAWGLVVDDRLVLSAGHGQTSVDAGTAVTVDSVFRLGSVTKVFTSLALLQLRDRGLLSLDGAVETWLPEFAGVVYPTRDAPLITPRHLMTHRSGLPRLWGPDYSTPDRPPTERQLLESLDGVELLDAPGLTDLYSNYGASLLGPLITRVSGTPYTEYVSREVLAPLGMNDTCWDARDVAAGRLARPHELAKDGSLRIVPEWAMGASAAAGGLYSSVNDLARFASFQLAAWPPSNRPPHALLAASSLRESHGFVTVERVELRTAEGQPPAAIVPGMGLGWVVDQGCRFEQVTWHNGGTEGHHAALYLLPQRGVGVVALANSDEARLDAPVRKFLSRLHDAKVLPERERVLGLTAVFREKVNAALAEGPAITPERYAQLFAPSFVASIPAETFGRLMAGVNAEFGSCHVGSPLQSYDALWVAAAVECERGERVLEAVLDAELRFIGFWINGAEQHAAKLAGRKPSEAVCPAL